MNFTEAIASGFQNYVNFRGRAARSEFWYWTLFAVIASIVGGIIDVALFGVAGISLIQTLAGLALFLPGLAVSVRRLHDLDRTGWGMLIALTVVRTAVVIAGCVRRGT